MFEEQGAGENRVEIMAELPYRVEKRCYSVDEIQKILDISRSTAYALIRRKVFKSQKVGKQIRISKQSFDAWLDGE